jgi:hypothetical protein
MLDAIVFLSTLDAIGQAEMILLALIFVVGILFLAS